MPNDRLTQELLSILTPLGVELEARTVPPGRQHGARTPVVRYSVAHTRWRVRYVRYRVPDVLSFTVIETTQGTPLIVCHATARRMALSREQLFALERTLDQMWEHVPLHAPDADGVEAVSQERQIAVEALRLEPACVPGTVATLVASAPLLTLTGEAVETLLFNALGVRSALEYAEARCFYAVAIGQGQGPQVRHLMPQSQRNVCGPALCGAYPPTPMQLLSAGIWLLLPIPPSCAPGQDEWGQNVLLCPDCLARWRAHPCLGGM